LELTTPLPPPQQHLEGAGRRPRASRAVQPGKGSRGNCSGAAEVFTRRSRTFAAAYTSLDDISYSIDYGNILGDFSLTSALIAVRAGAYQAGRMAGYNRIELSVRGIFDSSVKAEIERTKKAMRASSRKARWLRKLRRR
jgi:hypothetical protein